MDNAAQDPTTETSTADLPSATDTQAAGSAPTAATDTSVTTDTQAEEVTPAPVDVPPTVDTSGTDAASTPGTNEHVESVLQRVEAFAEHVAEHVRADFEEMVSYLRQIV